MPPHVIAIVDAWLARHKNQTTYVGHTTLQEMLEQNIPIVLDGDFNLAELTQQVYEAGKADGILPTQ